MLSASALTLGRSLLLARFPRVKSACKPSFSRFDRIYQLTGNSANTTVEGSSDRADQAKLASIPKGEELPPAPIDGSVDKWFFISGAAV